MVEYNRDRPLKNFVETMTRNRMQATKDGIDSLSQLYKVSLTIFVQVIDFCIARSQQFIRKMWFE